MKRVLAAVMCLLCMLSLLSGCRPRRQVSVRETEGVKIYFIRKDEEGRKYIDFEKRDIKSTNVQSRVEEILAALKTPKSKGAYLEVPEHIGFNGITLSGNVLYLDFSRSYKYLAPEPTVIISTLICKSLLDDGIAEYIKITCEGEHQPPVYNGYIHQGKLHTDEKMYIE